MVDEGIESLVRRVRRAGPREFEVFLQTSRVTEVHTRLKEVELEARSRTGGYAVRVHDGGIGIASAGLGASSAEKVTRMAVSAARQTEPVKFEFPGQRKGESVVAEDSRLLRSPVKVLERFEEELLGSSEANGVVLTFSKARAFAIETQVANSNGLHQRKRETYFETEVSLKAGGEVPVEFWILRFARSPDGFLKRLQEWMDIAKSSVGAVPPKSGRTDVIFPPSVATDLLVNVIAFNASAESVKRGLSKIKEGQVVAPDFVNVVDDGLFPMGLRTAPVDDEGNPQKRTVLVEGGVFRRRIYDQFYAVEFGEEPTGNGIRASRGAVGSRFLGAPQCLPTNVSVSGGDWTVEEMVKDTKDGLIVDNFAWLIPDGATGNFSSEIRNATLVEGGKPTAAIRGGVVSGNVFDLMKRMDAMTKDREVVSGGSAFSGVMPTIRFRDVEVAGN